MFVFHHEDILVRRSRLTVCKYFFKKFHRPHQCCAVSLCCCFTYHKHIGDVKRCNSMQYFLALAHDVVVVDVLLFSGSLLKIR